MTFYFRSTFPTVHVQKHELEALPALVDGTPAAAAAIARAVEKILAAVAAPGQQGVRAQGEAELEEAVAALYGLGPRHRGAVERWFAEREAGGGGE